MGKKARRASVGSQDPSKSSSDCNKSCDNTALEVERASSGSKVLVNESKWKARESKGKSGEGKVKASENKSKVADRTLKADESKLKVGDIKAKASQTKSKVGEISQSDESNPESQRKHNGESKSKTTGQSTFKDNKYKSGDNKPKIEAKSKVVDSKSHGMEHTSKVKESTKVKQRMPKLDTTTPMSSDGAKQASSKDKGVHQHEDSGRERGEVTTKSRRLVSKDKVQGSRVVKTSSTRRRESSSGSYSSYDNRREKHSEPKRRR